MIPFDEKKAEEMAAERGLSSATVKTWKHRGFIPDAKEWASDSDTAAVVAVLSLEQVVYNNLKSFEGDRANTIKKGQSNVLATELDLFREEVEGIRLLINNALQTPTDSTIKKVLMDSRLRPSKIVDNKIYAKATEAKRTPLSDDEKLKIRAGLILLKNRLKI